MSAQLIDGNALSRQLRADVAQRAAALRARGITPGLAVILVGDNPASAVYVRNKVKACADSGLHSVLEKHEATLTQAELLERIVAGRLNKQIADDLGISIKTVEAHRANIMEKLNANTVADLLKIALGATAKA